MDEFRNNFLKKLPALFFTFLINIIFFVGGVYLIIEEEDLLFVGIILVVLSLPILLIMLKYIVKTDKHGSLDVISFLFGFYLMLIIIALFLFIDQFTYIFFNTGWIKLAVVIVSSIMLVLSYFLSDKESFRLGGNLMCIFSFLLGYGILGFLLGGI